MRVPYIKEGTHFQIEDLNRFRQKRQTKGEQDEKMKRILITLLLLCLLATCLTACAGATEESEEGDEITIEVDFTEFEYDLLKNATLVLARVEVLDDLSEENSVTETGEKATAYSMRKIRILDVYKDNSSKKYKKGDEIAVMESTAIIDGKYVHAKGYDKLAKGKKYILFMSDKSESGKYSIISGNNGKIDLENISENPCFDIAVKTLAEFESNLPKSEIKKIIESKVKKEDEMAASGSAKKADIEKENATIYYETNGKKTKAAVKQ